VAEREPARVACRRDEQADLPSRLQRRARDGGRDGARRPHHLRIELEARHRRGLQHLLGACGQQCDALAHELADPCGRRAQRTFPP
jgi:hypothetical protein